jgi:hypothetical protein
VVLYSAIFDAVAAAAICAAPLHLARIFNALSGLERILLVAIWLLAGYSFAISIPTVIDPWLNLVRPANSW